MAKKRVKSMMTKGLHIVVKADLHTKKDWPLGHFKLKIHCKNWPLGDF